MRSRRGVLVLGAILAMGLAGCASSLGRTAGPGASARVPDTTRWIRTQEIVADAATYASSAPCASPPPAPARGSECDLPCGQSLSNWHVRGVGGGAFPFGTDAGSNSPYAGLDLGFSSARFWGVDLFYRTHCTSFDQVFQVAGAPPFVGEDKGRFHHIGLKGTYQRPFGNSRWFGYAGLGIQYFWTSGYAQDDNGWGGFGELGVGYVLSMRWRIRAAVETMVQSTDAVRLYPVDAGAARDLWVVAPVVQLEFDW